MSGIPKNGLRKIHLFKDVLIQKLKGQTRPVRPTYVYTLYYIYIYMYYIYCVNVYAVSYIYLYIIYSTDIDIYVRHEISAMKNSHSCKSELDF